MSRTTLRVVIRVPAGAIDGGVVRFNDRYAWEGDDYEPLRRETALWRYARDGELEYWAADLDLYPPRPRYRFGLDGPDGRRWLGRDGLRDEAPPRGAFELGYLAEGDLPDSPEWARGAVFYQVFPDRFARSAAGHRRGPVDPWDEPVKPRSFLGGDLDGIVERLDHICSLSVDALYLTPIFTAPSNHKYDTADYFNVDPDFGGNPALRRLVDALRARGMRLILDGVFNHAGAQWPPFVEAQRDGPASPYYPWFYFGDDPNGPDAPGRPWPGYETWSTNVAGVPKLRTSEPAVRQYILDVGRYWLREFGTHGWRLDVANEVDHATWRAFRSAVREVDPQAYLLGEVWWAAMPWLRGEQLDSVMNYAWRDVLLDFAARRRDATGLLDGIDEVRAAYPEPVHPYLYNLLGSHDTERPLHEVGEDRSAAGLAAALMFTLPGAASIYYGDEVGMTGGKEPASRGGMVWDAARQDQRMLALYRGLGRLKRATSALRGSMFERIHERGSSVIFGRGDGNQRVVVLANAGSQETRLPLARAEEWLGGPARLLGTFAHADNGAALEGGDARLPAQAMAVIGTSEVDL